MTLTRRQLAAAMLGATALPAQTVEPSASPDAELQSAREKVNATAQLLSAFEIPMSTEPAFAFKA